jgi:hypothetical protein
MSGASQPGWRVWPEGARVVVRRRLSAEEAAATGKVWTDIIGVVIAVDDDGVRLRTDPGSAHASSQAPTEVEVRADQIEAAKRIPPRPQRPPRSQGA